VEQGRFSCIAAGGTYITQLNLNGYFLRYATIFKLKYNWMFVAHIIIYPIFQRSNIRW
jgi:hypothetical protein